MNHKSMLTASLAVLVLASFNVQSAGLSTAEDGVHIKGGSLGNFVLSYPVLVGDKNQEFKAVEKNVASPRAMLKYGNGAHVDMSIADSGDLKLDQARTGRFFERYGGEKPKVPLERQAGRLRYGGKGTQRIPPNFNTIFHSSAVTG